MPSPDVQPREVIAQALRGRGTLDWDASLIAADAVSAALAAAGYVVLDAEEAERAAGCPSMGSDEQAVTRIAWCGRCGNVSVDGLGFGDERDGTVRCDGCGARGRVFVPESEREEWRSVAWALRGCLSELCCIVGEPVPVEAVERVRSLHAELEEAQEWERRYHRALESDTDVVADAHEGRDWAIGVANRLKGERDSLRARVEAATEVLMGHDSGDSAEWLLKVIWGAQEALAGVRDQTEGDDDGE